MGTLSKVAAGAASLIPFHCVICFDEFNLTDRVPMVLPCGHTYVCHRCTQRLSRCMECREPLFLSVPSSAFAANNINATSSVAGAGGRYSPLALPNSSGATSNHHHHHPYGGHHSAQHHPPPPPPPAMVKIPLSIPKNVVLISLMEAAQRQVLEAKQQQDKQKRDKQNGGDKRDENRRQKGIGSNPHGEDDDESDDDDDDDSSSGSASDDDDEEEDDNEEFNLDRIISGMATLSGPCGTYAVTVDGQVVVQPNDPRGTSSDSSTTSQKRQGGPPSTDPTSEEKKTDDPDAAAARDCSPPGGAKDAAVGVPPKLQQPRLSQDDLAECSSQDGLPLSPMQSAGSYASRADEECDHQRQGSSDSDDDDAADAANTNEPFVLRKGQTVQVVSLEDGVAKLARNRGYIVLGSSSHLVKVGGPIETVCRLEGLLDTIEGRGRDLQATLDENRQVELSLRDQIQAEMMRSKPNHPVITRVPDMDVWRRDVDSDSDDNNSNDDRIRGRNKENVLGLATTPPASTSERPPSAGHPRTPDGRRDSGSVSVPGSSDSIESRTGNLHSQQSPMSIDNADLHRSSAIPVYRRTVSEDDIDQLVFGCGAAFLGNGSSGLFSGAPNILAPFEGTASGEMRSETSRGPASASSSSSYSSTVLASRPRSATDHLSHPHPSHDYATPTLTSSFDGINFRTGMSGHRGLNHVANTHASSQHYSPTPRYRTMRLMSEHRGIGRPLPSRRDSPTGTAATSTTSSVAAPAFAPRLSPFPHHVAGGS